MRITNPACLVCHDTTGKYRKIPGLAGHPAYQRMEFPAQSGQFIEAADLNAIAAHGLGADAVRYDAAFGRPLDYYTGLVFEIAASGASPRVLAGGGRYDRLLTLLGAKTPIPGVGFSVWLDRIEALREQRQ